MSTPRRRILRPAVPVADPSHATRLIRLRTNLEAERVLVSRWLVRLKRAFNAFHKHQSRVARFERRLRDLEQPRP